MVLVSFALLSSTPVPTRKYIRNHPEHPSAPKFICFMSGRDNVVRTTAYFWLDVFCLDQRRRPASSNDRRGSVPATWWSPSRIPGGANGAVAGHNSGHMGPGLLHILPHFKDVIVIVPQTQEGNGKTESPNPVGDDSKICETKHQKRNPFNSLPCHWEIFLSWLTGAEISLEFTGMSVGGTTSDAGQDTIWFDGVEGDNIDDEDAANNKVESQIMAGIASAFGDRKICRLDMILADIDSKLAVHFHEVRTGLTVPN